MASSVGMLLAIEAAVALLYGTTEVQTVPAFLGTGTFTLLGTVVQVSQLVTFLFAVVLTAVLTGFFRYSAGECRCGRSQTAPSCRTPRRPARRVAWVIGMR